MRSLLTLLFTVLVAGACAQTSIGWLAPAPVANNTFGNLHPRLAMDKLNNPMVVWGDEHGKVWFAKWGGESFAAPVSLGPVSAQVFATSWAGPDIASSGDTVYVVYKEMPEETGRINIKHSYDGGKHFSIATDVDKKDEFVTSLP